MWALSEPHVTPSVDMATPLNVVILAAGEGKRMGSGRPKVLTPLWGRPSVLWPVRSAAQLSPERTVVVAGGRGEEPLRAALSDHDGVSVVRQDEPLGTGHAVLAAAPALAGASGDLLVLYGDGPLVTRELLEALVGAHRESGADLTLLSVQLDDPTGYGRVLRDVDGNVTAIVEEKDATPEQRAHSEVNAGIWIFDLAKGLERLGMVGQDNAAGEIYLTDLVEVTVDANGQVAALEWDQPEDVLGFNDHSELAEVRAILRYRIVAGLLASGVDVVDPDTTFVDADAEIAPGAVIHPCTVIEGRVSVAAGCEVGPFARLRDGTVLESGAKVGNFVETKKSRLGPGVKAGHLTYLGDADIGEATNIGAGTITANYDGRDKHKTTIGARAFIGSGTVLVAPSQVGDGASTGAGAIVTRNSTLPEGAVWVGVPARPLTASTDRSQSGCDDAREET
jgi:bifunctional UDP-N-acetylglucosamine pyrophosphorylase/glucosamine-1-phosphate N-acetyltransferase